MARAGAGQGPICQVRRPLQVGMTGLGTGSPPAKRLAAEQLAAADPAGVRRVGLCLARRNPRERVSRCPGRRAAAPQGCCAKLEAVRRQARPERRRGARITAGPPKHGHLRSTSPQVPTDARHRALKVILDERGSSATTVPKETSQDSAWLRSCPRHLWSLDPLGRSDCWMADARSRETGGECGTCKFPWVL